MRALYLVVVILVAISTTANASFAAEEPAICGNYEGRYNGGLYALPIQESGTFSQVFSRGDSVIYSGSGLWQMKKVEDYTLITFEPVVDARDAISCSGQPKKVG